MSLIDIVIICAVAVAVVLSVRRLARHASGQCGECASGSTCCAKKTGEGSCKVAKDMVDKADAALKK
jgi:hypothetical protein